ncbi:MAG: hypothetical protein HY726_19570 [Candidatus Rokubacteria bacterium]|nr:hypothetical protein [Candidatus Rokubacteria bacterium]
MAFFDLPSDEELTPEARRMLDELRRLAGSETVPPSWRALARFPKITEARVKAAENLHFKCKFPWDARNFAVLLIAHARGCQSCFATARFALDKLGFDNDTLNAICANPDTLPLKERDRLFVKYALKIATDSANLKPKDFKEMAGHGFSKEDVQEIIGLAAFWIMNIVISQSVVAALAEE